MERVFSRSQCCLSSHHLMARRLTRIVRYGVLIGMMVALFGLSPSAQAQGDSHIVSRGENLAVIARQYGVSVRDLMSVNGIANPNVIYVGQRLTIPGGATQVSAPTVAGQLPGNDGYYVVQRSDNLSRIASNYGMTTADLLRLNGLDNPNVVLVGQRLRVSARVDPVPVTQRADPELAGDIYVVQPGDTLSAIAQAHNSTPQAILAANGLPNANFVWVGQRLRINGVAAPAALSAASAPASGYRWIEVNLSTQTLIAWQGDTSVMYTNISSGLPGTPTVTGRYKIFSKYSAQRMIGPGYDLPGVPWVMYFYGGYALHGAYWHNNFGHPMSHGCVNMRVGEAQMLYNWAPMGTEVYVHY
jgi:LysM repeat protein